MPRPIHFEIPADDPARAIAFYEAVFGWTFSKWDGPTPYWLIATGADSEPGIHGGLLPRQQPDQPVVNTIGVADVDATVAVVERSGGQVVVPKMAVPTIGWLAYCKDTEGHIFGILQPDPAAQ